MWWSSQLHLWNGRDVHHKVPDMVIDTDASLTGWGAVSNSVCTGGLWPPEEKSLHINYLELLAGSFAVQSFTKDKANIYVHLRMDNSTARFYVSRIGGTRSPSLTEQACHYWQWYLQRNITLSAECLPGTSNIAADRESRLVQMSAEWKLDEEVFRNVCQMFGPCQVDLFASRLNNQLEKCVSWRPNSFAMTTNAFQISWSELKGYTFPPFALIGWCLQKIRTERCTVLLIAPYWKTQPWFPALLELLVDFPILLPEHKNLLRDPNNQPHPQKTLRLAAWKVSRNNTLQLEFLSKLQNCWSQAGAKVPTQPISQAGNVGIAGAIQGKSIPFIVGFNPY